MLRFCRLDARSRLYRRRFLQLKAILTAIFTAFFKLRNIIGTSFQIFANRAAQHSSDFEIEMLRSGYSRDFVVLILINII